MASSSKKHQVPDPLARNSPLEVRSCSLVVNTGPLVRRFPRRDDLQCPSSGVVGTHRPTRNRAGPGIRHDGTTRPARSSARNEPTAPRKRHVRPVTASRGSSGGVRRADRVVDDPPAGCPSGRTMPSSPLTASCSASASDRSCASTTAWSSLDGETLLISRLSVFTPTLNPSRRNGPTGWAPKLGDRPDLDVAGRCHLEVDPLVHHVAGDLTEDRPAAWREQHPAGEPDAVADPVVPLGPVRPRSRSMSGGSEAWIVRLISRWRMIRAIVPDGPTAESRSLRPANIEATTFGRYGSGSARPTWRSPCDRCPGAHRTDDQVDRDRRARRRRSPRRRTRTVTASTIGLEGEILRVDGVPGRSAPRRTPRRRRPGRRRPRRRPARSIPPSASRRACARRWRGTAAGHPSRRRV